MLGWPVRSASDSALVPIAPSSQRPPGAKFTRSARRRITRPPQVHKIVPCSSVTAATKPASSAMLSSSPARSVTGPRSGERAQRAPSAAGGALSSAGSTVGSERAHDSVTSLRTGGPATDPRPGSRNCGTRRAHSCSSSALRRRSVPSSAIVIPTSPSSDPRPRPAVLPLIEGARGRSVETRDETAAGPAACGRAAQATRRSSSASWSQSMPIPGSSGGIT